MKTVFVPVDFSDATEPVLAAAQELALAIGARVVLANVVQPRIVWDQYTTLVEQLEEAEEKAATQKLEGYRRQYAERGVAAEFRQYFGTPGRELAEAAWGLQPDYLVVGSHGHTALHDLLLGGTAAYLLRHVTCPVLVVPVRRHAKLENPSATASAKAH